MISPVKHLPLTLHLTFIDKSIGTLLAQEFDKIEYPMYYLSRLFEVLRRIIPRLSTIASCLYLRLP